MTGRSGLAAGRLVVIVRRTAAGAAAMQAAAEAERARAVAAGCEETRVLHSLPGRQEVFVISSWHALPAAQAFMRSVAEAEPSLDASADGLELYSSGPAPRTFHLILAAEAVGSDRPSPAG